MKSSWTEWRIPGLWLSVDDGPKQRPDQLDTNPQTEDAPSLPTEAHLSACDSLVVYREPPGASRMIFMYRVQCFPHSKHQNGSVIPNREKKSQVRVHPSPSDELLEMGLIRKTSSKEL